MQVNWKSSECRTTEVCRHTTRRRETVVGVDNVPSIMQSPYYCTSRALQQVYRHYKLHAHRSLAALVTSTPSHMLSHATQAPDGTVNCEQTDKRQQAFQLCTTRLQYRNSIGRIARLEILIRDAKATQITMMSDQHLS